MKSYNNILLSFFAIASLAIVGCDMPDEEIPQLELYTSAFIKQYGIPAEDQDWNSAEASNITVNLQKAASRLNVYVYLGTQYYRVARYTNVSAGQVTIPVDIPKSTEIMVVTVDGDAYWATPGCTLDIESSSRSGNSRDTVTMTAEQIFGMDEDKVNVMGWLVLVEDLGSTDDFDFNDVIFQVKCETTNLAVNSTPWNLVDQGSTNTVLKAPASNHSRAGEESSAAPLLTISALAAGGTLPIFLHFQTVSGDDYTLSPFLPRTGTATGYDLTSNLSSVETKYIEWHSWFYNSASLPSSPQEWTFTSNAGNTSYDMINTNYSWEPEKDQTNEDKPYEGKDNLTGASVQLLLTQDWFGDVFSMTKFSKITYDSYTLKAETINGFYIRVIRDGSTVGSVVINPDTPSADLIQTNLIGTWYDAINNLSSPQMMIIPDVGKDANGNWQWPKEREAIEDVYTGFTEWVKNTKASWSVATPTPDLYYSRTSSSN